METLFLAFDLAGPSSDARAAILAGLALMLIVMGVAYITSVLFGVGHSGRSDSDD